MCDLKKDPQRKNAANFNLLHQYFNLFFCLNALQNQDLIADKFY